MFLDLIKSIILGLVEGITEFLPISSTGHLIILNNWLSFSKSFTELFDIVIQLGAIGAVAVVFWSRLWPFDKEQPGRSDTLTMWYKTIVGVLPAIVLGALLGSVVKEKLFNPLVVALALIIGGAVLIWIERKPVGYSTVLSAKDISYKMALYIGLAQCLALIPGTSRSAATIIGAMLLGATRVAAVEFSFFLAIPTMLAASAYSLLKYKEAIHFNEFIILGVGFAVAFFTALAVIKFFLKYIQNHNFKAFGYYRIGLGVLVLLLFLFKVIV